MVSIFFGFLYAVLSIVFGAFIHHALKDKLSVTDLTTLQTASKYLYYNAIPLIILFFTQKNWKWPNKISVCFAIFGGLFSGSLILLVFTNIKWFAYLTPIGGLGLMLTWLMWLVVIYKKNKG